MHCIQYKAVNKFVSAKLFSITVCVLEVNFSFYNFFVRRDRL